ncbi:DUF3703 domain-containing protein, partial [Halobacteriovorax sp.]|uniref:DUF3703 domain-containing protein n=1 Tax=Halobacteriovorax sp. TaxID=2020862 RepID=UPI003565CD81
YLAFFISTLPSSKQSFTVILKNKVFDMRFKIDTFFNNEMNEAKSLIESKAYNEAFLHLERAHIAGQASVKMHTITHLYMLWIGILKRDYKEIIGQVIRIPLGIIGSTVGVVPTGNTGGSNVPLFAKMKVPKDIEECFTVND